MADLANVEQALTAAVTLAVYALGVPAGEAPISPFVGAPVRIRRGWPDPNKLDADLVAGIVNFSIFPMPGMSQAHHTLTASVESGSAAGHHPDRQRQWPCRNVHRRFWPNAARRSPRVAGILRGLGRPG